MQFELEYYYEGKVVDKELLNGTLKKALRQAKNSLNPEIRNVVDVYRVENGNRVWLKEYMVNRVLNIH
ncbi:hypothetical protein [Brevibacillus brevis]|uniref:hypothetical protein n=1 Tax=Brevibacillus brevis TaxID=1393 RepID=UPI0007D8BD42|nr:hypothetical protein [Brevibacillus brevis]